MNPNPPITSARSTGVPCHRAAGARKGRLRLAAAALAAAALAGCAAETQVLRSDAQLTAASLREGAVAVVGVVEKEEVEQVRPPLVAKLEAVLRQERPDLTLLPADRVREALGLPAYRKLLNGYQEGGSIDSTAARSIGAALHGAARYGVLARVVSNATRTSRRELEPRDSLGYRLVTGMLVIGRDARVSIQVYDLSSGLAVYDAQFVGSSEASRYGSFQAQGSNPGATAVMGRGPGPEEQSYPEAPDLASALEEAYRNFARSLPRPPS